MGSHHLHVINPRGEGGKSCHRREGPISINGAFCERGDRGGDVGNTGHGEEVGGGDGDTVSTVIDGCFRSTPADRSCNGEEDSWNTSISTGTGTGTGTGSKA